MAQTEPRIFISYSATESALAQAMCAFLEKNGLPCWIAPRDMEVGNSFSQTIIERIENSYALVLILSRTSNESDYVFSEIANAFQRKIPVLEFRVHPVDLHKRLELYLRMQHHLDATTGRPEDQFPTLYNHCAAKQAGPAPQQLHMTRTQLRQPDSAIPPRPLSENALPNQTETASRPLAKPVFLFAILLILLTTVLYLVMSSRGGDKSVQPRPTDPIVIKKDSVIPVTIPPRDSVKNPKPGSGLPSHRSNPVSKVMQALEGATFIDGSSPALATTTDNINFFGLQGNNIQFSLHSHFYTISGKMRIQGNHLEIIQAEPVCTGGMSVVDNGAKITGSFQVSTADRAISVTLWKQQQ